MAAKHISINIHGTERGKQFYLGLLKVIHRDSKAELCDKCGQLVIEDPPMTPDEFRGLASRIRSTVAPRNDISLSEDDIRKVTVGYFAEECPKDEAVLARTPLQFGDFQEVS